jgi:putative colanic acid biosynthesis acetyltransferase WcaF
VNEEKLEDRPIDLREGRRVSPWSFTYRVRMLLWEFCWSIFCSWTPKPLNRWRLIWLRFFGAKLHGIPFVHQKAIVDMPWNLTMFHRSTLGNAAHIYSQGPITIHEFATVAQEAYLCTGYHDFELKSTPLHTKPIVVEKWAFVGGRAWVGPGVTIGEGCIIGAMSLVTKSTKPWMVYAGIPARELRPRPPLKDG